MQCSEAWLGLLRLPLPSDLLKKILVQLHSAVMPNLSNPLLLSDFLSSCLDEGGLVGMLALNAIFTLVTRHGLEYPHFYARLYALLQVSHLCSHDLPPDASPVLAMTISACKLWPASSVRI